MFNLLFNISRPSLSYGPPLCQISPYAKLSLRSKPAFVPSLPLFLALTFLRSPPCLDLSLLKSLHDRESDIGPSGTQTERGVVAQRRRSSTLTVILIRITNLTTTPSSRPDNGPRGMSTQRRPLIPCTTRGPARAGFPAARPSTASSRTSPGRPSPWPCGQFPPHIACGICDNAGFVGQLRAFLEDEKAIDLEALEAKIHKRRMRS